MKSFRSTLIFAVIVAGLLAYAIFEMKRSEEVKTAEASLDRIFKIDEKDVQELQITRPDGNLHLVRQGDALVLKAPVEDRTDSFSATSFLNSIVNQSAKVLEEKNQKWADYGLEAPRLKVEVVSTKGVKSSYQIGSEKAFDGSNYLRDGDRLLIGSSDIDSVLSKKVSEIRDKKLYHFGDLAKGLRVISLPDGIDLKLVRRDGKWTYEKDPSVILKDDEVDRYLSEITNYRASDFVEEETTPQVLARYGLDKPQLAIELWLENEKGDGPHWWLKASKPKLGKEGFAYYSGRSTVYKVAEDTVQRLSKNLDALRNKKIPFEFKSDSVGELSLRTSLTDIRLVKKDGQWNPVQPVSGKEVDQSAVDGLLSKLKEMEARYYLGDKKKKGLGKESNSLKLADTEGKPLFEMTWGDSFKAKSEIKSAPDEELYYTQTNLASELLGVSVGKINELPRQTLLRDIKKAADPTPTSAMDAAIGNSSSPPKASQGASPEGEKKNE